MAVFDLFADHLLDVREENRLRPAEEIWYATTQEPALFAHAARLAGLSPGEYAAFRTALLDGKAIRVKLPHHVDAIVGDRRGRLYRVRNATLLARAPNWPTGLRVALDDGAKVYVADGCGNLAVLRHRYRPPRATVHRTRRAAAIVYVQPPPPAVPPRVVATPEPPPAKTACGWWCFGLPLDDFFARFRRH